MRKKRLSGQAIARLILRHFSALKDPRVERTREYPLPALLVMALVACLGGADGFKAMALHAHRRRRVLNRWLGLRLRRAPCADTFRRLFGAIAPHAFEACFRSFAQALLSSLEGQVVALDGKALVQGVLGQGPKSLLQMLHVWAGEQRLVLTQQAVPGAPGECAAAPELLRSLQLQGAIVTGDANFCTQDVMGACVEKKAHYVLALKGNRGPLHDFAQALCVLLAWQGRLPRGAGRRMAPQRAWAHGRYEMREAWAMALPRSLRGLKDWPGLRTLLLVHRTRQVQGQTQSEEWHLYVSDMAPDARLLARAVRAHWGVENHLHWRLDVQMGEDARRVRHAVAAQNLARVHRMALTLLERDNTGPKMGIALKRQDVALSEDSLRRVLSAGLP